MNREELLVELEKIGIMPTKEELEKLEKFYDLLIDWNKKINLTRITDKEDFYLKHVYDSLTIVKVVDLNSIDTLCDVGTGAGFPGIILKIFYPHLKITLIDSLLKRVKYLNEIIKDLEINDIEAIHSRGEDFSGSFDVVTSRAVANLSILPKYTMHLVKKDGVFIAMKGDISRELTYSIEKEISKRYEIVEKKEFNLPKENSKRSLIVLKNK